MTVLEISISYFWTVKQKNRKIGSFVFVRIYGAPNCLRFYLTQRFVSSTRNIEVLLSHTHSIVCDNDTGGLFLGCFKSCKMAAHNLKIHFNFLFMILHKKVSKMFRRVFLLIEKYVL